MVSAYWASFWGSIGFAVLCAFLFILGIIYMVKDWEWVIKRLFPYICGLLVFLFLSVVCVYQIKNMCKDYSYVRNHTYIEEKAIIEEITITKGRFGEEVNRGAKVRLLDSNEYIYFDIEGVTVGKTYIIRYYPHTKICEVVEEVQ